MLLMSSALSLVPVKASAIEGGESAENSPLVIASAIGENPDGPYCSMSMITSRILVSVAHCFAAPNTADGTLKFPDVAIWAIVPGAVVSSVSNRGAVRVKQVILVPGYANFFDGPSNDTRGQKDDIAFLFLERELIPKYEMPIANAEEVSNLKVNQSSVELFGYGGQRYQFGDTYPYKIRAPLRTQGSSWFFNHAAEDEKTVVVKFDSGAGVCGGDSGGPIYSSINGVRKLVAVIVSGGGCRQGTTPPSDSLGTVIYPYLDLMKSEFDKFLQRENQEFESKAAAELKAKQEVVAKKKSTITCKKGKLTKKVTAVKPKCPSGYRRAVIKS